MEGTGPTIESLLALVESQKQKIKAHESEIQQLRAALRASTASHEAEGSVSVKREQGALTALLPIKEEKLEAITLKDRQRQNSEEAAPTEDLEENNGDTAEEDFMDVISLTSNSSGGDDEDGDETKPIWDRNDRCYRCPQCSWEVVDRTCHGGCDKIFSDYSCGLDPEGNKLPETYDVFFETINDYIHPAARGDTPLQDIEPARLRSDTVAYGYEDRREEYQSLLERGATRLMCEAFYLEYNQEQGILLDMRGDLFDEWAGPGIVECNSWRVMLGRDIRLNPDDEDGSHFIEERLEECLWYHNPTIGWETVQQEPGTWITRPSINDANKREEEESDSDDDLEYFIGRGAGDMADEVDDLQNIIKNDYESDNSGDEDPECNPDDNKDGIAQLGRDGNGGWGPKGYWYQDPKDDPMDEDEVMYSSQDDSFDSDFESQID